ncbi:recombinase family protein, partial [Megasphaera massiliensis]|uniref:recombinase family protein n=2 Tax=Megasphaera TaxID=906 RepID=UPI003AF451E6
IGEVSMKKRKEPAGDAKNVAVIYARYSSSKQREESIDGQLRVCHAFAENEGLIVMHEYIDRAMSARTDRRPDFLQMIQDSDEKKFSYVIVYQLDRFARSRYDSAIYKHRLKKNGVTVLSANERIANDPTGILLEALIEANAEFYSAELSQKVNRGMMQNVLEGKWPGGRLPLGYELNENRELITNKEQAAMVKKYMSGI